MPLTRQPLAIELALLGFLRQQPRHGYEIYRELVQPAGLWAIWRMKQSQLYALLDRLEAEGYLAATLQLQETRPPRKVFRLTKAGRDAFSKWVRSPVGHGRDLRLEFLAKFYFARREGSAVADALIQRQKAACQTWLEAQRAEADQIKASNPDAWLVCQFRTGQLEATLAWLDQCADTLKLPIA